MIEAPHSAAALQVASQATGAGRWPADPAAINSSATAPAPGERSRLAALDDRHRAVSVEFDFVNPLSALRRLKGQRRQHGRDEGGRTQHTAHRANLCALSRIASQQKLRCLDLESPRLKSQEQIVVHCVRPELCVVRLGAGRGWGRNGAQGGQHDIIPVATVVVDGKLLAAGGELRPLRQPRKPAVNRIASVVGDDLEGSPGRRLKASEQGQVERGVTQLDMSAYIELVRTVSPKLNNEMSIGMQQDTARIERCRPGAAG